MVRLNALRAELGLPPATGDHALPTVADAAAHLPGVPAARWRLAYSRLLAADLQPHLPAVAELLSELRGGAERAGAERHLAAWLAAVTGGEATVRSSWGEVVARQGTPSGDEMEARLSHDGRPVGSLHLHADAAWRPLFGLVAEVLCLARLQSAAAGAARRRVGERTFEALLSGDPAAGTTAEFCVLAALRLDAPLPRAERARDAHIHRLDVLCAVGEGYLHGRGLACLTTVRGDLALWLWRTRDAEAEARGLHLAVQNAFAGGFRLGLSAPQPGDAGAREALAQARQALGEVRGARGLALFRHLDPLAALLEAEPLAALAAQVRGRLREADDSGRLEDTLRHYLAHRGALGALAARLNLHVNTLRYRLRRIEDVLDGDLSEPAFVARLYLAMEAHPTAQRAP